MSAQTAGVHHVGLTVPDIRRTRDFFVDLLGFDQVAEKPDYPAVFVSDGAVMITLWQAHESARAFDRHGNVGLHHLALAIAPDGDIDAVHAKLAASGQVRIEFAPQPIGDGGARHLMCTIPGGLRLEIFAADG
jgi:catechol 2,3-dioxygenase-like lactoylglutathione lyase family enzyme